MVEQQHYITAEGEALIRDSQGSRYLTSLFNGFTPSNYDEITLTYTGENVDTVIYKLNNNIVGTLQLLYTDNRFVGIKRI